MSIFINHAIARGTHRRLRSRARDSAAPPLRHGAPRRRSRPARSWAAAWLLTILLASAGADGQSGSAGSTVPASAPSTALGNADSTLTLPARMMSDTDPVATLLRQGRFAQVIVETDGLLEKEPGNTAVRLYQRGIAQLNLGQNNHDPTLIKDAGLSFMRVVIFFSKSGNYCLGPSLMEAGYVHQLIQQPQLAHNLYERAAKLIDAHNEPGLRQRLDRLRQGPVKTEADSIPSSMPAAPVAPAGKK